MDLASSLDAALVVESQTLAQSHIKYTLLNIGFKSVVFADRASVATKALSKQAFDLILCAYDLNSGADGYQLFEKIIAGGLLSSKTAFIFMSSENEVALSQSIIELKPDDFILKPFTAKELELRLRRILNKKQTLSAIFEAIDSYQYDDALKLLNEQLAINAKPTWVPYLLKLKGEIIAGQRDWSNAEKFYKKVLIVKSYAWANIGLVHSLINQNKISEAEAQLTYLVTAPGSRLAALDILANICKNRNELDLAIEHLKNATSIAPRNVSRQKDVMSLARITHDYETQYHAATAIVEHLENSIHDTPSAYLSAVRTTIDYGLASLNDEEMKSLTNTGETILRQLKKQFPGIALEQQINVAKARLYNMNNEQEAAKQLINADKEDPRELVANDLEDALDKAKAFHELGFFADSESLFELIAQSCREDDKQSDFAQYIKAEQSLRIEIKNPPKVINNKAVEFYSKGNLHGALKEFRSAFKVMPKNPSIALNLFQTVIESQYHLNSPVEAEQIVTQCLQVLDSSTLTNEQIDRFGVLKEKLN